MRFSRRQGLELMLGAARAVFSGRNDVTEPPADDADITITVASSAEQVFRAAGFSISRLGNPYAQGQVGADSDAFNQAAFSDLGATMVRWWYDYDVGNFADRYVHSGAYRAAQEHGVAVNLLAPIPLNHPHTFDLIPSSWHTSGASREDGRLTSIGIVEQPKLVAGHIRRLRDEHGVVVHATGQLNEPCSAWRTCVDPADYAAYARSWRRALDDEGLTEVAVIGLEWQPPRGQAEDYAERIAADPDAKAALDGLASHSYGFTISDEIADLCRANGWNHWQTEAGGTGSGSEISCRFLSDINRRNTNWVFFLGPHTSTSGHSLLAPGSPVDYTSHYWALRMLWRGFVPGTVIHRCTSSLEGAMRWVRGDVKLNAAAGVRPDGRWVVGLSNETGNEDNQFRDFPPAEDYDVAVGLPSAPAASSFAVARVPDGQQAITTGETVGTEGSTVTVHVPSREVVVLLEASS